MGRLLSGPFGQGELRSAPRVRDAQGHANAGTGARAHAQWRRRRMMTPLRSRRHDPDRSPLRCGPGYWPPRWPLAASCASVAWAAADNVAWQPAAADADIDRAFAQARAEKQAGAAVLGRQLVPAVQPAEGDAVQPAGLHRAQQVASSPVRVDGDLPGAQKLGARFKVSGYPTMVLLRPDGAEITRLPGEADAPQVMPLLQPAWPAAGRRRRCWPTRAPASRWRPTSGACWPSIRGTPTKRSCVPAAERARRAGRAGRGQPGAATARRATRLWLKALAASDDGKGVKPDAALRKRVRGCWPTRRWRARRWTCWSTTRPRSSRRCRRRGGAERTALVAAFDAALQRLQADATLSRGDRVSALIARVDLARLDQPKDERHAEAAPALLQAGARRQRAQCDREITDGYERQAVITAGGLPAGPGRACGATATRC